MKHSLRFKIVAVFLSALIAIISLMPVVGSDRVSARTDPYQPKTDESPAYTGPLTWVDFTQPLMDMYMNSSVPESVYVPFSLDFDSEDNLYMTEIDANSVIGGTSIGKVEKISNSDQSVTDITYNGEFHYPSSIAVDSNGNVFVTDNTDFFMDIDNSQEANIPSIWMLSSGSTQWIDITNQQISQYANGITTDRYGNVYVIDGYLSMGNPSNETMPRIMRLYSGMTEWQDITGDILASFTDYNRASAIDLAVDGEGNLFVSTLLYNWIEGQGTNAGMSAVLKMPAHSNSWTQVYVTTDTSTEQFIPFGIDADPYDTITAMSILDSSIKKLGYNESTDGWENIEVKPATMSMFNFAIASDSNGYLYRSDLMSGNIKRLMASLIYDGNGGSGLPEAMVGYEPNETAVVAGQGNLVNQDNPDLSFAGWNTEADGSGDSYAPGDTITMNQSIELFAQWTAGPTVSAIDLDSSAYSLYIGGTHQTAVTAQLSDQSTTTPTSGVTYTSSDTGVATVDTTGLVTAVATGQTVVTVTYQGHEAHADVTVKKRSSAPVVDNGVEIIVDGVKQEQLATAKNETVNGLTVTTIQIDSQKVIDKLNREQNKVLTIPVKSDSKVIAGQLNGSLVKAMQDHEATIEIVTDNATYTLPASQIDIDGISAQIGKNVSLDDLIITIQLSESSDEQKAQVEASADSNNYQIVGVPFNFEVTASYGSQSVDVNHFNAYVERTIAIPDGMDPSQITTGVVLTNDGELFHVPTSIVEKDGKYYAQINSLTNSTYSVIYNPKTMEDVQGHWAQVAVNDMTSRLIIRGATSTEFDPDAQMTRAEFAAILTRALGIQGKPYGGGFTDVDASASLSAAVQAAADYQLIHGYEDASFRPDQTITRQEAAVVLARALSIANLDAALSSADISSLLSKFADGNTVAGWAKDDVAAAISLNLLNGRNGQLDPGANLTRAEAATLVYRLLTEAGLINE